MPVETLSYTYTSQTEIEHLLSQVGVSLRVTDLTGDDLADYWTELIAEATDTINFYALWTYDADDMADNRWVRSRATWIALVLLCRRRANPVPNSVIERYEEILNELRGIYEGRYRIPRLSTTSNLLPSMSNMRVDDRFLSRKLRVNPSISVGGTDGNQDLDWMFTYDWF